jgi:hypothetical protein
MPFRVKAARLARGHRAEEATMDLHVLLYVGLALAYVEGALQSFVERDIHCGCREFIIAVLYISIALTVLDPGLLFEPTLTA